MIVVTEAGYHGCVAFSAYNTRPLSASIRSAASGDAAAGSSASTAEAAIPMINPRRFVDSEHKVTGRSPFSSSGLEILRCGSDDRYRNRGSNARQGPASHRGVHPGRLMRIDH